MANLRNITVLLLLLCCQSIWATYVIRRPEHSSNQLDTIEMKRNEIYDTSSQQSIKYPITDSASSGYNSPHHYAASTYDGNGQTYNAMLAKTSQQQRHHTSYDKNDDVVNANNNHENAANFQNSETTAQTSLTDANGERNVDEIGNGSQSELHSRQRRELSDWLIAPNTRWCGRGNTANGTYNHLGGASRADKCCRKHDHCKMFIPAMSNRFGLFNYRPYTMSHCNCDTRFRTCLKMAGDEDANTIGKLFFNMVDTQCFVLVKERICVQRATNGTCEQEHIKKKAYLRNNKRF